MQGGVGWVMGMGWRVGKSKSSNACLVVSTPDLTSSTKRVKAITQPTQCVLWDIYTKIVRLMRMSGWERMVGMQGWDEWLG